jgi:hypothetical protein
MYLKMSQPMSESRLNNLNPGGRASGLTSIFVLTALYASIFYVLDKYDWNNAFVKFCALGALLGLVLLPRASRAAAAAAVDASRDGSRIKGVVIIGLLAFLLTNRVVLLGSEHLGEKPRIDIGSSTEDAARTLFQKGLNPYSSRTIAPLGDDPRYWGYKYGPTMLLGYLPVGVSKHITIAACNVVFLGAVLVFVVLLTVGDVSRRQSPALTWEAALFAYCLVMLPNRVWYELFHQGVIDFFPTLLLVASLYFVSRESWAAAGLLAGLSLSAKFAPAVFYISLFFRKDAKPRFFAGVVTGALPLLACAAWDGPGLMRNYLLFHLKKSYDSTSLYSITPHGLHWIFPAIQLASVLFVIATGFGKSVRHQGILFAYIVLLIMIEMTYKEVHENHLLWLIPFLAIYFSDRRYAMLPAFGDLGRALTELSDQDRE